VVSFPYFNGTGSVCVCIHKSKLQRGPALHYSVDLRDTNVYDGIGFVKIRKTRHKISVRECTDIFTVQHMRDGTSHEQKSSSRRHAISSYRWKLDDLVVGDVQLSQRLHLADGTRQRLYDVV